MLLLLLLPQTHSLSRFTLYFSQIWQRMQNSIIFNNSTYDSNGNNGIRNNVYFSKIFYRIPFLSSFIEEAISLEESFVYHFYLTPFNMKIRVALNHPVKANCDYLLQLWWKLKIHFSSWNLMTYVIISKEFLPNPLFVFIVLKLNTSNLFQIRCKTSLPLNSSNIVVRLNSDHILKKHN